MKQITKLVGILALIFLCSSFMPKRKIEIVVHRGANHLAPENTMASTIKCIELGVAYVEVDINMSKDGVMYILHDDELDRTTNGTGKIRDAISTDIDKLDAGSWFGEEFAGEKVPRIKEYLEQLEGKTKIYFDFKNGNLPKLVEIIKETGFEKDCFFWFGNHKNLEEFHKLNKKIPLKMNAKDLNSLNKAMAYDPQIIECSVSDMTPEFVKFCRKNRLKIMAYGKDTEEAFLDVLNSPAQMVNLNKPELMLEMMKK